jgi:hypothetical protein
MYRFETKSFEEVIEPLSPIPQPGIRWLTSLGIAQICTLLY